MNQTSDVPPRAWQRMLSGRRLDLLNPCPDDIEIADIAHGLARVARWNGQTLGAHAFSVAQHCLLVDSIFMAHRPQIEAKWRLAALLHDAPEYVIGDLISPFKAALGLDYKAFEKKLQTAIHLRFGLPEVLPAEIASRIKDADRAAAYWEATRLAGFTIDEALTYFGRPTGTQDQAVRVPVEVVEPWSTADAQWHYLQRFSMFKPD